MLAVAALWTLPVFGVLHAESSAVVAGLGFFVAGLSGGRAFRQGAALPEVVGRHLALLLIPLSLLTLSLLWRPNCGYLQGLGLYVLMAPPSVLLGVALSFALTGAVARRTGVRVLVIGVVWGVGGVLSDLLLHPQLFTYSHVFGGVLGPIYDAELAIRPGLFAAKAQTLLWVLVLVAYGRWRRGGGVPWTRLGAVAIVALGMSYALAVPLGIQQSAANIERTLAHRVDLGAVVLHLDPEAGPAEVARLADEALFRFEQITARLGVAPAEVVHVYLYPDADTKARLIGSRYTSVTSVWLPSPQIHMLADEVPRSLAHEWVHVVAREFGLPVLGASPAVGLVEGLAVALEPPDGLPSASALVRAGMTLPGDAGGLSEDPAQVVAGVMDPLGFWTARAGVAYTASGAFTGWLLDRYGADRLRQAYATGDFEAAYGVPLVRLTERWMRHLEVQPVDAGAVETAAWLFRRPSLFEVRCPHHTPLHVRLARLGDEALEDSRPTAALAAFESALARDPLSGLALDGRQTARARLGLAPHPEAVDQARALADTLAEPGTLRLLGDALRLVGHDAEADAAYVAAMDSLRPGDAVSALLLARRARLGGDTLARLLAASDSADARLIAEAPVLAALVESRADRPEAAWEIARRWCIGDVGEGTEKGALRLLQAQAAYRAGHLAEAVRLNDEAASGFETVGLESLAALAQDASARVQWRARFEDQISPGVRSILGPRSPSPDGLRPSCRR